MSLNVLDMSGTPTQSGAGAAAGAGVQLQQAPRLPSGGVGYAAWRDCMDVYLQRMDAQGVHRAVMTEAKWLQMEAAVEAHIAEQLAAAIELVLNPAGSSSSSSSSGAASPGSASSSTKVGDEMKQARGLLAATVDRSRKVYGILYSSLPEELRPQVGHIAKGWAHGLWHWLETKFQSTEEDSVGELLAQWTALQQGEEETFDAYRARVVALHALLTTAKEKPSSRMFAFTLLDRLQPRYKPAVLALKAGGTLKDADKIDWVQVAALINAHEREEQRIDAASNQGAMSLQSYAKRVGVRAAGVGANRSAIDAASTQRVGAEDAHGGRRRERRPLNEVQCFRCKAYGHYQRTCTKKAPNDEKQQDVTAKPQGSSTPAAAGSKQASAVLVADALDANPFALLTDSESDSDCESGFSEDEAKCEPAVPLQASSAVAVHRPVDRSFGIDTMASLNVTGDRRVYGSRKLEACKPCRLQVANGEWLTTNMKGTVPVCVRTSDGRVVRIEIEDVYYHPSFSKNLLSWGILKNKGWSMSSDAGRQGKTTLRTPGGDAIGLTLASNVSILAAVDDEREAAAVASDAAAVYNIDTLHVDAGVRELVRQHERLGHIAFHRLVKIIKHGTTLDVSKRHVSANALKLAEERIRQCRACAEGKGRRTRFGHRGLDRGLAKGEALHMDTFHVRPDSSPHVQPPSPMEYGLIMTDGFTKMRWFRRQVTKDAVARAVISVVRNAQTQLGCKVKRLYADGGSEFLCPVLRSFCEKEGIELRPSPPHEHELNGVAERSVDWIKGATRTLMEASRLPKNKFWMYAARHATYVWNRTAISKRAGGVTPYESMHGRAPSAKHWGVFGCDGFYHVPKHRRGATLAPKMEPCIYLGHDEMYNCPVVYALRQAKVIVTRSVRLRCSSFKFGAALAAGDEAVQALLDDMRSLDTSDDDADGVVDVVPEDGAALQGGLPDPDEQPPHDDAALDSQDQDHDSDAPTEDHDPDLRYELDEVIGYRKQRGSEQLQVRWSTGEVTWESAENIMMDAPDSVEEYFKAHPRGGAPAADSPAPSASSQAPVRRSPRLHPPPPAPKHAQALQSVAEEDEESQPSEAQVHMVMSALVGMQSRVSPSASSPSHAELLSAIRDGIADVEASTPKTYREAMSGPDAAAWREAMQKEFNACESFPVWELVRRKDVPSDATILPAKWVYKVKMDETGGNRQFKARITPKGFLEKANKDYFDVFAPTGSYKSMRVGLSLTAKWNHELEQLDVPTAFLNADMDEDIYMELPEGFTQGKEEYVCKLKKSLYGLKQSPRNWYLLVSRFVVEVMRFKASVSDPCLFFKRTSTGRLMLLFLFVDDFQVSFHLDDASEWREAKRLLIERFRTKDMGESKWILGMRIQRDRKERTIKLNQELYLTKILEKYGFDQCRVCETPEVVGLPPVSEASVELQQPVDRQRYMEITGSVMYAAISTRPDIAHACHYLASHMQQPCRLHLNAAERILRYLSGTKTWGLIFGSRNGDVVGDSRGRFKVPIDVTAYSDADFANDKLDRKSITGWVAKLNGDPVSWRSKKQATVALSTCEAELYAKCAGIQEVLWLRGLLKELGLDTSAGSRVHCDNQSAISVAKNGIKSERTKHVDVKYHFVTEQLERGHVQLQWVPTQEQQADIFTKPLPAPAFLHFRQQLMAC